MHKILLNNVQYNINKLNLPWGGKVNKIDTTATYKTKEMIRLDGSTFSAQIFTFKVTCNKSSPEPGRVYAVYATKQTHNNLVVQGYMC